MSKEPSRARTILPEGHSRAHPSPSLLLALPRTLRRLLVCPFRLMLKEPPKFLCDEQNTAIQAHVLKENRGKVCAARCGTATLLEEARALSPLRDPLSC